MSYDAIIAGSGFGGSCAAYALSRAGLKTLVLERGQAPRRDDGDWDPRKILIEKSYRGQSPIAVRQYDASTYEQQYPNEVLVMPKFK